MESILPFSVYVVRDGKLIDQSFGYKITECTQSEANGVFDELTGDGHEDSFALGQGTTKKRKISAVATNSMVGWPDAFPGLPSIVCPKSVILRQRRRNVKQRNDSTANGNEKGSNSGQSNSHTNVVCWTVSLIVHDAANAFAHMAKFFELFGAVKCVGQETEAAVVRVFLDPAVSFADALALVKSIHAQMLSEGFPFNWFQKPQLKLESQAALSSSSSSPSKPLGWTWWQNHRAELLAVSESPAYVYNLNVVRAAAHQLLNMQSVSRIFFAIKANSHPDVVRLLWSLGVGMETVSIQELNFIFDLLSSLPSSSVTNTSSTTTKTTTKEPSVLFTPNFCSRSEYEQAFVLQTQHQVKCWITVDSLYPLMEWPDIFRNRKIFLRIDPGGTGHGHHSHVRTAGELSKFGISTANLQLVADQCREHSITVVGLHAHAGSGILNPDAWLRTAELLVDLRRLYFPCAQYFDVGGGLGVVYGQAAAEDTQALDLNAVDQSLAAVARRIGAEFDGELWMEPGRFLVAEAGVLLATVTQIKTKGTTKYVGCDTGFNSLLRPILYDAYHPIINLTASTSSTATVTATATATATTTATATNGNERVTIVGNICESGDILGKNRLLPVCRQGDRLLIGCAGAYGHVMASGYNKRQPAPEIIIQK